jgi:hypothetical protein
LWMHLTGQICHIGHSPKKAWPWDRSENHNKENMQPSEPMR